MAEYYRTNFTVENTCSAPDVRGRDLLSMIQALVSKWATNRGVDPVEEGPEGSWKGADGATFLVDGGQHEASGHCRLVLEHPDDDTEDTVWRSDFRLATEGKGVDVEVEIRRIHEGDEGQVTRSNYAVRPRVLKTLFNEFTCSSDNKRLSTESEVIPNQNSKPFANEVLMSPTRRNPVVVVVENAFGGIFIDPNRLQSSLLGLANVFTYDNETARLVNREFAEWLGCWDGTVRVYRPGCSRNDPSRQNVYWNWKRMNYLVDRHGWKELLMEISDECLRHSLPQAGQRLYDSVSLQVSQAQSGRVLELIKDATLNESTYQDLLTDAANNIEGFRRQNDELRQRRAELESANEELRAQVEQLNVALSYQDSEDPHLEDVPDEILPEFNTVYDAVKQAADQFDGIRFFALAMERAKGSEFPRPKEVYDVFETLDECANKRRLGPLGTDTKTWLVERGIEYSPHESDATMGKFGDKRIFYDNVTKQRCEMKPHIKLGGGTGEHNQLRIHLEWDDSVGKWLVGYIGRHLPTVSG